MNANTGSVQVKQRHGTRLDSWQSSAPWVAPLLTAGVLALATFVVYSSCGAALI